MDPRDLGQSTRAAHAHLDGVHAHRPMNIPLVLSSNYSAESSVALSERFRSRQDDGFYTRFGHPTIAAAERKVAELEGTERALVFSSGMAAITTSLLAVLKPGDHVVAQRNIFAQTFTFLDSWVREMGIETDFVDSTDLAAVRSAVRDETVLVYIETPSNPLLDIVDVAGVAEIARAADAQLFVDGTFASPVVQRPTEHGATLTLHSGSKYLGGHSDLVCGAAAGPADLIDRIRQTRVLLGGVLDPHGAWLLLRGLKTLAVRVERQCENAWKVARFLEAKDGVKSVSYPWLESSPGHELARRQMSAGGGMVSFVVEGGREAARAFLDAMKLIPIASSLGGVETIAEIPADLDFASDEIGEAAEETGIDEALVRLSVGIEDVEDLYTDLERGLEAARARARVAAGTG